MPDQLFDHATALNHITEFYDEQKSTRNEELCKVEITREFHSEVQQETRPALETLLSLPKSVQICFSALIQYLKDFKLEKILRITRYYILKQGFQLFCKVADVVLKAPDVNVFLAL